VATFTFVPKSYVIDSTIFLPQNNFSTFWNFLIIKYEHLFSHCFLNNYFLFLFLFLMVFFFCFLKNIKCIFFFLFFFQPYNIAFKHIFLVLAQCINDSCNYIILLKIQCTMER
jgi:hypothetical protein